MKSAFGAIILAAALGFPGAARAQSFDQTMHDWFAAMSKVDVEAMDKMIAPNAKFELSSGAVQSKAEFLDNMRESKNVLGKDPIRYKTLGVTGNEMQVAVCYNLANAGQLMRQESYRLVGGLIAGASEKAPVNGDGCAGF